MITGKSDEDVIKDMETDGPTGIGQLIGILDYYGVGHAEKTNGFPREILFPTSIRF